MGIFEASAYSVYVVLPAVALADRCESLCIIVATVVTCVVIIFVTSF
jgi:hypothetical protein